MQANTYEMDTTNHTDETKWLLPAYVADKPHQPKYSQVSTSARSSVLAKRRDINEMGPPETLRWPEMEVPELELSLDLGERDFVFSPPPGEVEVPGQAAEPGPLVKEKHKERVPISLSDEERRERDLEMKKIADRLVATLTAACSKKKKRKH